MIFVFTTTNLVIPEEINLPSDIFLNVMYPSHIRVVENKLDGCIKIHYPDKTITLSPSDRIEKECRREHLMYEFLERIVTDSKDSRLVFSDLRALGSELNEAMSVYNKIIMLKLDAEFINVHIADTRKYIEAFKKLDDNGLSLLNQMFPELYKMTTDSTKRVNLPECD